MYDILDILLKHFNFEFKEGIDKKTNEIWCRLVSIQSKQDDGEWDTTAMADLHDYVNDYLILKNVIERRIFNEQ